jgi:hypothetical protein
MKQPRNRPPPTVTPARLALVRELWPTLTPTDVILEQLAALPGRQPVKASHPRRWAQIVHVTRPREIADAERAATRSANRVVQPTDAPPDWRTDALRRLAAGQWTVERLTALCDLWDAGHTVTKIAERLIVTPNAVSGRIHRLQARGLIEGRVSPIIRDGEPPKPRPVNAPAPAVTLPPLPSVVVERAYSGVPKFSFAAHRPPLPVVPITKWHADDGSWPTGPARRPCQFVTRDGSVTETWVMCGLPVSQGPWCKTHRAVCYYRARAA